MKPAIALATTLIAACALVAPVQAHDRDRGPGGGQRHGWHDSRPNWGGPEHGHGHWQGDYRRGPYGPRNDYGPRYGYGYQRYYGHGPGYVYPPAYADPPAYAYPRYYRHYDHDYDYYYGDYDDFDASGISLLIALPLRF